MSLATVSHPPLPDDLPGAAGAMQLSNCSSEVMNINLEEAKTTPNNVTPLSNVVNGVGNTVEAKKNDLNTKVSLNMPPALAIHQDKVVVEVRKTETIFLFVTPSTTISSHLKKEYSL